MKRFLLLTLTFCFFIGDFSHAGKNSITLPKLEVLDPLLFIMRKDAVLKFQECLQKQQNMLADYQEQWPKIQSSELMQLNQDVLETLKNHEPLIQSTRSFYFRFATYRMRAGALDLRLTYPKCLETAAKVRAIEKALLSKEFKKHILDRAIADLKNGTKLNREYLKNRALLRLIDAGPGPREVDAELKLERDNHRYADDVDATFIGF